MDLMHYYFKTILYLGQAFLSILGNTRVEGFMS